MNKIKIAPSVEEITRENNVFSCEFNGMRIKWIICADFNNIAEDAEKNLKNWLCNAIGFSSKIWQVPLILNKHMPFKSEVYINDNLVTY